MCQDVLSGRNRRLSRHVHLFSGGLLRCAYCGFAMTGERIRRRLKGGGVKEHVYYRCGNNHRDKGHPPLRWREEDLEQLILEDFATLRMPSDVAEWFRVSIRAAFVDTEALCRQRKQTLTKRRTELAGMQDRLLNGYLSGTIEERAFQAKSAELKRQIVEVEASLEQAGSYDPDAAVRAAGLFDFSQKLVEFWEGSNSGMKREILDCVSLNRTVSDVSLCLAKRKPFGVLAERLVLQDGRGGRI